MTKDDIILTGLPRGGTTLACHLLNKLPDVVALHEPMKAREWGGLNGHDAVCDAIESFFQEMRSSINSRRTAISKHTDGKVPDNPWGGFSEARGMRMELVTRGEISIEKPLRADFLLVIKHASEFTAILESLSRRFPAYAIVRNPLSVLASWNTVDFPINAGHSPSAEPLDSRLREALERIEDKTARQLHLLSWLFEAYHRLLPPDSVVRYEDIVQSGGKALRVITPHAETLNQPLISKNQNELYPRDTMQMLGEKLLASDGAYWNFYSRESVGSLLV